MGMNYDTDNTILIAALAARKGSGGNISPEQIQQAVDNYLSEHPVSAGKLTVNEHIVKIIGE